MSKTLGKALSKLANIADYTESIVTAAKRSSFKFDIDSKSITSVLEKMDDDILIDVLKKIDSPNLKADILKGMRNSPDLADNADLLKKLDEIDGGVGAPNAVKSADELIEIDSLSKATRLSDSDATKVNRYFSEMSDAALDVEADIFVKNWKTGGEKAFKNLPNKSQEILLKGNQKLRYQAKRSTGLKDKMAGACKSAPVYCDIGKGLGGLGAAVGVGFALKEVYDAVVREYNNDEEIAACIATCYPDDWYFSEVSGSGDKDYKDLTGFKTIEGLKKSTGNDDITVANTPLCHKNQTGEQCHTMCEKRCRDLNKTFLQKLTNAVTDPIVDLGEKGAEGAGNVFKKFLDGIFGEGMGIPAAIGIVIFIFIIIIVIT